MTWKLGTELNPADRARVLASYVYRMTHESLARYPEAGRRMRTGGYRMPILTDAEWLARTRFAVRRDGRLDARVRYCNGGAA